MTITYQMIKERAMQDARDVMPDLPEHNTVEAWESFINGVESANADDMGEWDWVIYYHHAIALCLAVPGDVLSQAESELADMGGMCGDVTLYGLACQLAALIVQREISEAVEKVRDELLELANNAMENL